jgi:hypothetical protein
MIAVFDLAKPELFDDPLKFFAVQLDSSLPKFGTHESAEDVYGFRNIIEQVAQARHAARVKGVGAKMKKIRDHVRLTQYHDAIRLGATMSSFDLSIHAMRDLLRAMLTAGWGLDDASEQEVKAYNIVIELGNKLLRRVRNEDDRTYIAERMSMAMVNKGLALGLSGKSEEAIEVYDEVMKRFLKSREFFLRQRAVERL